MASSSPGRSAAAPAGQRDWWLRTLLVLQAPRPVFLALRNDTDEAAANRAEPVLAVILLAGIAGALSTSAAGHLLDDPEYDGTLVAIWVFLGGGLYGVAVYWLLGAFLYGAARALGSRGSYRRSRHVLAFASVPIALTLGLWLVKLAAFGSDLFHRGGSDAGATGAAFDAIEAAFVLWSAGLLLIGVRAVHGWPWSRAAAAVGIGLAVPAALSLAAASL